MKGREFQAAIDKLNLSQMAAARLLCANPRTTRRHIAGDRAIPPQTVLLVRLLLAGKITVEDIEQVS